MGVPENDIKALQHRVAALSQRIRELESAAEEAEETRQALALSEQRFRLAFQTSPDAIYMARHIGLKSGLPIESAIRLQEAAEKVTAALNA